MRRSRSVIFTVVAAVLVALLPANARAGVSAGPDAVPSPCAGPAVQTFGPASVTAAIVGATVVGDKAYVVTRGLVPPILAEIDLATRKVVRSVEVPSGEGGWAATVSGGKVYIGMYTDPDVYRFDPATGELTKVGNFGPKGGFVWELATAPDGMLYAVTSPDGGVWEINPDTNASRRIARPVPGAQYGRYLAVDATHVYASVYSPGKLVAVSRADGSVRDLTPPSLTTSLFGPVRVFGDRIVTTILHKLVTMNLDGSDVTIVEMPEAELYIDAITEASDGTIYVTTRRSGSVYRYRPGDTGLTKVATTSDNDEHRAIVMLDDTTMFGAAGSGAVWWLDTATGEVSFVDLIDAGLPPGPEKPQTMVADDTTGTVYVGGHWAIEMHKPATGERRRVRVPGEIKNLLVHDGLVYMALYPGTQLAVLNPRTEEVRVVGTIANSQQRPWDMAFDDKTGLIVVASAPGQGELEGALTVFDPRTGRMDVYRDIIDDQAVMSLDTVDGVVYLGGDVVGGGSVTPTKPNASVLAFDLTTRKPLWQVDPLPGNRTFQDLVVQDGVLYGVMKRNSGTWFAMDLATRTVKQQGSVGSYGETFLHRGRVFATVFTGQVWHIGPDLPEARVVQNGLGAEWGTDPHLSPERDSWYAWGVSGRELARIRIDPRCPPQN